MKRSTGWFAPMLALSLAVSTTGCGYNTIQVLDEKVNQAQGQIQTMLQRRADLIPNLVKTVEGAASFEKSTLTEITNARASVGQVKIDPSAAPTDPNQLKQFEDAQNQLGGALSRLLVVSERYPELKSNQNFLNLQAQLEGSENRIAVERGRFNETVQAYNTAVKSFPAVLYAGALGFQPKPYFTGTPQAQTPPTVQFNFGATAPANAPTTAPAVAQ